MLVAIGTQALIAKCDPDRRDYRLGAFTVAVSLGQLIGPAAAGVFWEHLSLSSLPLTGAGVRRKVPFRAAGVAGSGACLIAAMAKTVGSRAGDDTAKRVRSSISLLRSVGRVLRQPNAPHAMVASVAVLTTADLLVAYFPAFGEAAGISPTTVGVLLSARAGASIISRLFLRRLAYQFGHGRLLMLSTAVPALIMAPLPLMHSLPTIFTSMILAGFGLGLGQPLSLILIARASPDDMKGTALAVRLSGNRLGQVAIPALVGSVVGATGIGAVFVVLSIMLAGSSFVTAASSIDFPGA